MRIFSPLWSIRLTETPEQPIESMRRRLFVIGIFPFGPMLVDERLPPPFAVVHPFGQDSAVWLEVRPRFSALLCSRDLIRTAIRVTDEEDLTEWLAPSTDLPEAAKKEHWCDDRVKQNHAEQN
jgi:hypothetical protein